MGGVQGVGHKLGGIGTPLDDVDLLALELLHHPVHAAAPLAHAGAHGINHHVGGMDGHLGAAARFPGDGLDGHHAPGNLRHFHFKQPLDQVGVDAADPHLRSPGPHRAGTVHLQHIDLDVVAVVEHLAGDHVLLLQHALGAAQLHIHRLGFHPLDDGREDLAFLLDVLVVDLAALRLADALHNHLLGRLRGHPQEARGRHVHLGDVAHLVIGAQPVRILQANLAGGLLHLGHDELAGVDVCDSRLPVHGHRQVGGHHFPLGQVLFIRGLQRLLNGVEQQFLADALFLGQGFQCLDDFGLVVLFLGFYCSHAIFTAFRFLHYAGLIRTSPRFQCRSCPPPAAPWRPLFAQR